MVGGAAVVVAGAAAVVGGGEGGGDGGEVATAGVVVAGAAVTGAAEVATGVVDEVVVALALGGRTWVVVVDDAERCRAVPRVVGAPAVCCDDPQAPTTKATPTTPASTAPCFSAAGEGIASCSHRPTRQLWNPYPRS